MKECDTLGGGVKKYSDPSCIFSVGQDPTPTIYAHANSVYESRGGVMNGMYM